MTIVLAVLMVVLLVVAGFVVAWMVQRILMLKEREFDLLTKARDREFTELESIKKSYMEIAAEAVKSAVETTNYYLAKDGKPPLLQGAAVVAEGSSPPTLIQHEYAAIATLRAKVVAIKLAMGQPPRSEPGTFEESLKKQDLIGS